MPLVSLSVFVFAFSLGFGPIPWLMMSELFAPEVTISLMINTMKIKSYTHNKKNTKRNIYPKSKVFPINKNTKKGFCSDLDISNMELNFR